MSRRALILTPLALAAMAAVAITAMTRGTATLIAADELGAYGFHPGELVFDFGYQDADGNRGTLLDLLQGKEALVIAIRTTECPVSQKYGHRLARLEKAYADHNVAFAYLDVSPQDTEEKIRDDLETFGFEGTYIVDPDGDIGAVLQATVSTEAFIIDKSRTLRYRGAVDDQFGITFSKPEVRETYLIDALDDVVAGRPVKVDETEASGCYITTVEETAVAARDVTYHSRASRIIQNNCVTCHRDGGVAPFALDSYQQAYGFREMIKWVVEQERMPPWFANPEHGEFANDRRLSDRDRRDLMAWVDAGAPEGDATLATTPRTWVEGWQLDEEPDVVIAIPEPQQVPAEGVVDYQYVFVQTNFDEDKWIQKIEPKPSAPEVTHHIIVYLQGPDDRRRGLFLGGNAPGVPPAVFPEGTAKRLPKDAWLMFELHYTPNGRATTDLSSVGLVFADEPPQQEVFTSAVGVTDFEIPAHTADHEVVGEQTFDEPGTIFAMLPHMHLRGKSYRYELIKPDGTEEILLDVPNYDFNWQLWYQFKDPIVIKPGYVLRGTAHFDNSEGNPANPDPSMAVRYGEQSFEEMMFGFFEWIPDKKIADSQ